MNIFYESIYFISSHIRNFLISDWALLPLDPITSFTAIPHNAHSCYFLLLLC